MIYRIPIKIPVKEYLKYLKYFKIEAVFDIRKNFLSMNRAFIPLNLEKLITTHNIKYLRYDYKYGYLCDDLFSMINTNGYKNVCIIGKLNIELDETFFKYLTICSNHDIIYYDENKKIIELDDIPF